MVSTVLTLHAAHRERMAKHMSKSANEFIVTAPRIEQERQGRIRTYTGRYVNPLALQRADICIEDIAHHLANLCRYTGACPQFYSVAQHSVLVSARLRLWGSSVRVQLAGLLHDAGEAYFNDLASPVKHDPRMQWYRDAEHEATRMILTVFGLDPDLLTLTKKADNAVFDDEAASWWGHRVTVYPSSPRDAESAFLKWFHRLHGDLNV